jgi:predicted ribosome quality control (RQC) complex YloA/Tae2 family protein
MATRMNLGGEYAEEIAFRLGIDKDQSSKESLNLVPDIINGIKKLLEEISLNKGFYYDSDNMLSPVRLSSLKEDPRIFEDFNEGLVYQMGKLKEIDPQISQIERRIANQTKTVQQYMDLSVTLKETGQIIISNLPEYERVLRTVNSNLKAISIGSVITPGITITNIDFSKKFITIKKDDREIELSLTRTAGENASDYFNRSKDYILKAEGARKAIMDTSKVKLEENGKKKKDRPKKWFEAYHWFFTSSGNLVIAGKDVNGNEKVVKKHMSEKDIYIHADLYGAPSTILKVENENTDLEKDILEAAQFAVSNSRAWSNNLASGSAYWVTPLQVSKTPESGEFVRKGSWIVKGKRNYLFNLPLKLKISTIVYENTELPMICPHITEIKNEKDLIFISPGEIKREKIAKEISEILGRERDEIASILPPGGSRIDSITKKVQASISQ